jgi:hypothetical protein
MASNSNDIKGKLALITGASGGIGRAISRQLVLHELDLALHYSTNLLAIEELVAQLRKDHEVNCPEAGYLRISIHQADLSVADECVKLCEGVAKEHGRSVDVLVSNAGFGKRINDIWLVLFIVFILHYFIRDVDSSMIKGYSARGVLIYHQHQLDSLVPPYQRRGRTHEEEEVGSDNFRLFDSITRCRVEWLSCVSSTLD